MWKKCSGLALGHGTEGLSAQWNPLGALEMQMLGSTPEMPMSWSVAWSQGLSGTSRTGSHDHRALVPVIWCLDQQPWHHPGPC